MPEFSYRARDAAGRLLEGSLEASTRSEALSLLTARRLQAQSLQAVAEPAGKPGEKSARAPAKSAPARSGATVKTRPLSAAQQLLFTTEMVELLQAGLQLEQALGVMESREERSALKSIAAATRMRVREGASFSKALQESGSGFPPLFVSVCSAGEAAGALPKMLESQAAHMAFVQDLQRRLVSAMVYPSVVLLAGIGLLIVFMTFLLPQLTSLLGRTGQQLPIVTRFLVATSEWLGVWWWTIPVTLAALFVFHRLWVGTPAGRTAWDGILLKIPLVGDLLRKRFLAQFLQTLATLSSNGVNLLHALSLVRGTFGNTRISAALREVSDEVAEGVPLSRSCRKQEIFPPALIDILRIGEQTGDIAAALRRGAEKYDREFNLVMQRFATLIQPLSILIVALFVGVVAYAMITGILTTVSGLRMR
jgi:type II secretory pathway component PulF